MLSIGICDDNVTCRAAIKKICKDYFDSLYIGVELGEYGSAEEVINSEKKNDLLFLDIEMGAMSGIELKDYFWDTDSDTKIIFVSGHSENMSDAYGDNVQGFIRKPVDTEAVVAGLERFYKKWSKRELLFCTSGGVISVKADSIVYIKADHNYVRLVTDTDNLLCDNGISYWEEKVKDYPLYRIHRSYIVNLEKIKKTGTTVELKNGESIRCAREKVRNLRMLRMQYLKNLSAGV